MFAPKKSDRKSFAPLFFRKEGGVCLREQAIKAKPCMESDEVGMESTVRWYGIIAKEYRLRRMIYAYRR